MLEECFFSARRGKNDDILSIHKERLNRGLVLIVFGKI